MYKITRIAFVTAAMAGALAVSVARTQDKDLTQTLSANDQTKTFTTLVQDAGLADTLKSPGPYTLLVPNDAAFATLQKNQPELYKKLSTDKSLLKTVIQYHTLTGSITSTDLKDGADLDTLSGEKVHVTVNDQGTTLDKTAKIVTPDLKASNGNIDVIDTVLLPKSVAATTTTGGN